MRNINMPIIFVLLAFLLELALLTFGRNLFGYHGSPVFLLLAGVTVGALPIILKMDGFNDVSPPRPLGKKRHLVWLIFTLGLIFCAAQLQDIIAAYDIDPKASDVIPAIEEIYVKRTLEGSFVYRPFHDFGYPIFPNYLPLQWMPYLVSGVLNFDHRWMAFGVLCLALFVVQLRILRYEGSFISLFLKSTIPWFTLYLYLKFNHFSFGYSLEPLIVGYYLIFGLSLLSKSSWKRGGGLVLTLMSRYISLLFIPLYAFVGVLKEGWKPGLKIALLVIAGIVLVYVLPYMTTDPEIFFKGFEMYSGAAHNEWLPRGPENRPPHLHSGIGMASWFYTFAEGSVQEKISFLRNVQIFSSLFITAVLGIIFSQIKDRLDHRLFLLFSFKIYLAVFFGFIQVPYVYLFLTSVMFSTLILAELSWVKNRNLPSEHAIL